SASGDHNNSGEGDSFFQVISTAGDTHMGGDDVDHMIVTQVLDEIRAQFGVQLEFPPSTRQALRSFAEAAKIKLSSDDAAALQIDLGEGRRYDRLLKRDELNKLIQPWVERAIVCCQRAMRDAKLTPAQIDRVVLVGGS